MIRCTTQAYIDTLTRKTLMKHFVSEESIFGNGSNLDSYNVPVPKYTAFSTHSLAIWRNVAGGDNTENVCYITDSLFRHEFTDSA